MYSFTDLPREYRDNFGRNGSIYFRRIFVEYHFVLIFEPTATSHFFPMLHLILGALRRLRFFSFVS